MPNLQILLSLTAAAFFSLSASAKTPADAEVKLPQPQLTPVELSQIRITGGAFLHAQEMDKRWLLSMEPDRYLSGFRTAARLEPKAPRYGGWESAGCSGHAFGHYLSAMAMMYASTGDSVLLKRLDYSLDELALCQKTIGTGFVAGFPDCRELFAQIESGDIRSQGFDLNGGWVPLYTMHKLFAGLVDVYHYTGDQRAYKIVYGLADWMDKLCARFSDDQMAEILRCEHGGINESIADVYALTGEERFLKLAARLNHRAIMDPLAEGRDDLPGKHANTQIPKIVGAIRQYELGGDTTLFRVADFFWNTVVHNHTYVIGGNSEAEHFGVPGALYNRISGGTCETCNTYNMLKLTRHLYQLNPSVEMADYYERALYNQILGSQDPNDGMVCYMSPMGAGTNRGFSTPYDSFWCCVGSGMENHAKYGEFIYFTDKSNNLFVNLYIPTDLTWKSRDIEVSQQTSFPENDQTTFTLSMKRPQHFTLNLRYPEWATKGCTVTINGRQVDVEAQHGSYIALDRKWSNGDQVSLTLPMPIHSEAIAGDETIRAYLYGPIVLCTPLENGEEIPVMVADPATPAEKLIRRTNERGLHFVSYGTQPAAKKMIPYYAVGGRRMMVYYNHFPLVGWETKLAEFRLRQNHEQWLRERTVSHFTPGEMQPERDHNLKGENTQPGEHNGRKFREAKGGWFSFEMAVAPDVENTLYCTYWGGLIYHYMFDIYVDDQKLAYENIHNWGAAYIDRNYKLPEALTKGKEKITITFRAVSDDKIAGPLFDCRIMK